MPANIFITGVSSGIGLALAEAWLNKGAHVFGISRREPAQLLRQQAFRHAKVDLSDLGQIEAALHTLLAGVRTLDVAVLNAGVLGKLGDLADTSIQELKRVMDVNVWANKVAMDALLRTGTRVRQIVTMSSGAAVHAERGWNGYALSKAALNMLTALYAAEQTDTHFCALAPGIVDTAMQDELASLPPDPRFPSFQRLKEVKGTPFMPKPGEAAERLINAIESAMSHSSGSFLDMRELTKAKGGGRS